MEGEMRRGHGKTDTLMLWIMWGLTPKCGGSSWWGRRRWELRWSTPATAGLGPTYTLKCIYFLAILKALVATNNPRSSDVITLLRGFMLSQQCPVRNCTVMFLQTVAKCSQHEMRDHHTYFVFLVLAINILLWETQKSCQKFQLFVLFD